MNFFAAASSAVRVVAASEGFGLERSLRLQGASP